MLLWQRHIPQPSYQKFTGCVVNLLACCHFWRPKDQGIKTVFGHLKVIQLKVFLDHSAPRKLKSQEVLQIANTVTQTASFLCSISFSHFIITSLVFFHIAEVVFDHVALILAESLQSSN